MNEADEVLNRIRAVMRVEEFHAAANAAQIDNVEQKLAVQFPEWLRRIYLACNGFLGPTGVQYLYPLEGHGGVLSFNEFIRQEEWSPPWISSAVIFGDNGLAGTSTVHWAALDGELIEWCLGDGQEYTVLETDLFSVWKQEQEFWDSLDDA